MIRTAGASRLQYRAAACGSPIFFEEMHMQNITVGSIVEALCGKCNDVMGHTVMVMLGGQIARVECRACGSVHRFRPAGKSAALAGAAMPRERKAASAGGASRSPSVPASRKENAAAVTARAQWLAMAERRKGDTPTAYQPALRFAPRELVQHSVFGLGEVIAFIAPDKIDVLFENGVKRLICNKG